MTQQISERLCTQHQAQESNKHMETQRKDSKGANLPEMEGFLVKKGAVVKSWKKRWCILRDNALAYYSKKVATQTSA